MEQDIENALERKPQTESRIGPIIGSVIIIALIVLGGLYYWNSILDYQTEKASNNVLEEVTEEAPLNTSDTIESIEDDLDNTDLDDLDQTLDNIDKEIDAVLN